MRAPFLCLVATLGGCAGLPFSSMTDGEATAAPVTRPVITATADTNAHRDLTVAETGGALGGAARIERSVRHVLWHRALNEVSITVLRGGQGAVAPEPVSVATVTIHGYDRDTSSSTSIPAAWRRYCDGGAGMTPADWEFVRDGEVPSALAASCVHPK